MVSHRGPLQVVFLALSSLIIALTGCAPARPLPSSASTIAAELERTLAAEAPTATATRPQHSAYPAMTLPPIKPYATPAASIRATPYIKPIPQPAVRSTKGDPTGPAIYSCALAPELAPILGIVAQPDQDFLAVWEVGNNGNRIWSKELARYAYLRGAHLQKLGETFALPKNVLPGESIRLAVDMRAPNRPGVYQTYWSLTTGPNVFCTLELKVEVRE